MRDSTMTDSYSYLTNRRSLGLFLAATISVVPLVASPNRLLPMANPGSTMTDAYSSSSVYEFTSNSDDREDPFKPHPDFAAVADFESEEDFSEAIKVNQQYLSRFRTQLTDTDDELTPIDSGWLN